MNKRSIRITRGGESGAALVTVIFLTFILLVACVALLSAVGAGSANSADVLAETKAYYAAESGLQATINVLRNTGANGLDYKTALTDPDLDTYLSYCTSTDCDPARVVFANGTATYDPEVHPAYSVQLSDPDNTEASLTFNTVGTFEDSGSMEVSGSTVYIPSMNAATRTEITFTGASSTTLNFPSPPTTPSLETFPSLGTFQVSRVNGGVALPQIEFNINYRITAPRQAVRTIRGTIAATLTADADLQISFLSQVYKTLGSDLELCKTNSADLDGTDTGGFCSTTTLSLSTASPSASFYGNIEPLEPFRLKILSTGYGPRGARKQLEAIVQKDFFNGLASGAATTMIGPNPGWDFLAGTSEPIEYNGCDTSGEYCVPSFGFTDPTNLADALAFMQDMNGTMDPPPALLGSEVPGWQSSVSALDQLVDQLRSAAQNSGRYFKNTNGPDSFMDVDFPAGSVDSGQGITFCEGSCRANTDGGGILVVTGKLTNVGGWSFTGLIIVTGEDGWVRKGGGDGRIIGNVVIAPYNLRDYVPENLATEFLAPKYQITGGGASEITYSDISATFDGTSSINNIMLGVSEK